MNEEEFLSLINCKFPYEDKQACLELIDKSVSISDNASYAVLEAICCRPFMHPIKAKEQLELIEAWRIKNNHPGMENIIEAAIACVSKPEGLPEDKVLRYMDEVAQYKRQYKALMILYSSIENTTSGAYQDKYNEISRMCDRA